MPGMKTFPLNNYAAIKYRIIATNLTPAYSPVESHHPSSVWYKAAQYSSATLALHYD